MRQSTAKLNPHRYQVIYTAETDFGRLDIYRSLAVALRLEPAYRRANLWRDIKAHIEKLAQDKQTLPVWIIDEARNLPPEFFRDFPDFLNFAFDSSNNSSAIPAWSCYVQLRRHYDKLDALFKNIFEAPAKPEAEITSDEGGNLLNPVNDPFIRSRIATQIYRSSLELSRNGNLRTQLTSALVGEFIKGVEVTVDEANPAFSRVALKDDVLFKVEVLKHFAYEAIIMSPKLKVAEYRGKDIVREIFEKLSAEESKGISLLANDCQELYNQASVRYEKKRVICNFIAGMTDRYAIEFYERLTSSNAQSMFKPL